MNQNIIDKISDDAGNMLIVKHMTITPDKKQIFLKLVSESRERHIGDILLKQRVFYSERKRSKHLHNKSNSYGFNYDFLSKAKAFDEVIISDELGCWSASRKLILDDGKFLFFKEQGFEKQIFLEVNKFTKKPSAI